MNNFNPNYNLFDNGDENYNLFSSPRELSWHSFEARVNIPQAENGESYNKYVPQPQSINYPPLSINIPPPSLWNHPGGVPYDNQSFPIPVGSAPFYPVAPPHQILSEPIQNVNNFPVPSVWAPRGDSHNFVLKEPHERFVKSSVNGNQVRVLTYTRDEFEKLSMGKNMNCNFCKRLGKPKQLYSSHNIRENGLVSCPILRQSICSICQRRGHTSKYCQSINGGVINN